MTLDEAKQKVDETMTIPTIREMAKSCLQTGYEIGWAEGLKRGMEDAGKIQKLVFEALNK